MGLGYGVGMLDVRLECAVGMLDVALGCGVQEYGYGIDTGWDIGKWDIYGLGSAYGMDLEWIWQRAWKLRSTERLRLAEQRSL